MSPRSRGAFVVFFLLCATALAVAAMPAFALEWGLEGGTLTGEEKLAEAATVTQTFVLKGTILGTAVEVDCAQLKTKKGFIKGAKEGGFESVELSECTVPHPEGGCKVSEPLKTAALTGTLEGTESGGSLLLKPKTGTTFAPLTLTSCALAGSYKITGTAKGLLINTDYESPSQALEFTTTSGSSLALGGAGMSFVGTGESELATQKLYGAFEVNGPRLRTTKPKINYGPVLLSAGPILETSIIRNFGNRAIVLGFPGTDPFPIFSFAGPGCSGATIKPQGTGGSEECTVGVEFQPKAIKKYKGFFSVRPVQINLAGEGI